MTAGLVLAAALGFAGARAVSPHAQDVSEQRWTETASALRQGQDEVGRLAAEVRTARLQIEALRGDRQKGDPSAKLAQANERLEKSASENAARIAKLSDQIDRMEKTQRDPSRIAALVERLDRIEKQTQTVAEKVAMPVPPPKPAIVSATPAADIGQTGSLAAPKPAEAKAPEPDPRKTQLEGYLLRDIGDGVALVESRNGRLLELRPGQTIGVGNRVEAIERRGRQWVVVTQKGFIADH